MSEEPVVNKIYEGYVSGVKDFGCFVVLKGVHGNREGLVHISDFRQDNLRTLPDYLKRNQRVLVKVKSYSGKRMSLSIKEVDQRTGEDLLPTIPNFQYRDRMQQLRDEFFPVGASRLLEDADKEQDHEAEKQKALALLRDDRGPRRAKQRISSPDLFEWVQLARTGAVELEEQPYYDEEYGVSLHPERDENLVEQDVELNEDIPMFLRAYVGQAGRLSPAKIVKNPHGSLHWATLTQSALAKERREMRDAKNNALLDSMHRDSNYSLREDPIYELNSRQAIDAFMKQPAADIPEWKRSTFGLATKLGWTTSMSIQEQRRSLPVYAFREKLLEAISNNRILIVVGETGSGKTTQLTQYLDESGYSLRGRIGCTQPRRVAATSVAQRVSEEVGCRLGEKVGYSIRFEDMTSPETCIKYMTDGMLLRECLVDPDLKQYSAIILDEAHERSIHTDVLMALMKQAILRRPDLKLIVTSATLDAEKFSKYFMDSPIFTIPGRTYPVEILWTREPETDYLDAALITVLQIHINEPPGDILVFLTGQEEIDTACQVLYERMKKLGSDLPELLILPIYSALPSEMQSRIFEPAPPGARKVIIGTNIAETSVTIDGIYYVIDPGFVKQKVYNPKTGMDALIVCPISKAQAKQRSGRAGRTGPGKCYRLYTEAAYNNEMLDSPVPEIQRTNLANTVLTMKALGINELFNFDFMDKPAEAQLFSAMNTLYTLGALDEEGLLTRLGRKMADFPLDPQLAKMLLTSVELGCSEEVLSIVAMLSVHNVFYRPKDKAQLADQKRSKFFQPEGDHLTFLAVYEGWKASRFSNPWCYENFIQARSMRRAQEVRKQLLAMMDRYKLDIVSCGKNYNQVRKSIVSGFFANAAKKDPQEGYKTTVEGTPVYIHPSSSLFQKNPDWVIYHELVQTTKEYMREVTVIEAKWLGEFAPKFYKMADPNKITKRKKRERLEPFFDKWREPNEWRLSKRRG
ncbi:ATP-dependent RNA helicase dhx8-like [Schistocerca gregaria]|uniref:ATP-dependent RNA helicase dhx8-like n=1 Tax=Schistocerca gregaria TaxID=7010 RepID=UPI00211DD98A|nr:ATP-dependent RNA helicase dhx8-like [Schistocerca gregaria]